MMRKLIAIFAVLLFASAAAVQADSHPGKGPKAPKKDQENAGTASVEVMAGCALSTSTHGQATQRHLDVWWSVSNQTEEAIGIQVDVRAFGTRRGDQATADLFAYPVSVPSNGSTISVPGNQFPRPQPGAAITLSAKGVAPGDCTGPLCPPPDLPTEDLAHSVDVVSFKICESAGTPVQALVPTNGPKPTGLNAEVTVYLGTDKMTVLGGSWCEQVIEGDGIDPVLDTENIDIDPDNPDTLCPDLTQP